MSESETVILHKALGLPSNDRAALVESLIASLDKPDPALDKVWLKEAEDRMEAYRVGEIDAIDADQVFSNLGTQI